jgi:hypothetical protein
MFAEFVSDQVAGRYRCITVFSCQVLATDTVSPSQDCCVARRRSDDQRRLGQAPRLEALDLSELKTILVPRQALLKRLDPTGELSLSTVRTQLEPLVHLYERLVIQDRVESLWMMAHT